MPDKMQVKVTHGEWTELDKIESNEIAVQVLEMIRKHRESGPKQTPEQVLIEQLERRLEQAEQQTYSMKSEKDKLSKMLADALMKPKEPTQ